MSEKATKSNGKTAVKKAPEEKIENLELRPVQRKQLEDAMTSRQLAQQNLVMMNNAEYNIKQIIIDAHGIDYDKVLDVNLTGNILKVTLAPEDKEKDD